MRWFLPSIAWLCLCPSVSAQPCAPEWSEEFYGGDFDDEVRAFVVFDDGSGQALYAGGWFTQAGGNPDASGIARWNGKSWQGIGGIDVSGPYDQVNSLAVYDDGSGPALYAAGHFGTAGGIPANGIARWNGSAWSSLDTGVVGTVDALVVHDDGSGPALYVSGMLSEAGGIPIADIARWNGSAWSDVGGGFPNLHRASALAVFDDGSGPALYGGRVQGKLGRWDGVAWTGIGQHLGVVYSLATATLNGVTSLYAGGEFGGDFNHLARWDGKSWTPVGQGYDKAVYALAVGDAGDGMRLYVSGDLFHNPGSPDNTVLAWDGTTLGPAGSGVYGPIRALIAHDDGSGPALYCGGGFSVIRAAAGPSVEAADVARLRHGQWSAVGNANAGVGFNHDSGPLQLVSMDLDGDGPQSPQLYASGVFRSSGTTTLDELARWNGTSWSPLGNSPGDGVASICAFDDGSGPALYATDSVPGAPVVRWNGVAWSSVGFYSSVSMLVGWRLAGEPQLIGYGSNAGFAALDGETWLSLGANVEGRIGPRLWTMNALDDGTGPAIYVGGLFESVGGVPANSIARWDGHEWSALGQGTIAQVSAIAVYDDGAGPALYAGGTFTFMGDQPAAHIARWDGVSWTQVGGGLDATPYALAVFDDGSGPKLYAAGQFTTAGGKPAAKIASWDGQEWSELDGGLDGYWAQALAVHDPDGAGPMRPSLYVSGNFRRAGGISSGRIARWGCLQSCYADLDGDGSLDLFDFLAFLNAFNAGGSEADCDGSAALDLFDFLCFTNAFNAGC